MDELGIKIGTKLKKIREQYGGRLVSVQCVVEHYYGQLEEG